MTRTIRPVLISFACGLRYKDRMAFIDVLSSAFILSTIDSIYVEQKRLYNIFPREFKTAIGKAALPRITEVVITCMYTVLPTTGVPDRDIMFNLYNDIGVYGKEEIPDENLLRKLNFILSRNLLKIHIYKSNKYQ
jgi:hypothetical protein